MGKHAGWNSEIVQGTSGIAQLARPREDILIGPVDLVRRFGNRDCQFITAGQKFRFARCFVIWLATERKIGSLGAKVIPFLT